VDVHRIFDILRVPEENSIGCEANLTTTTHYTRPTRLLYCVSRLPEVVSLYYTIVWFDMFEVNNKKCNFLESMVFVLL